jgi:hypothetical protein
MDSKSKQRHMESFVAEFNIFIRELHSFYPTSGDGTSTLLNNLPQNNPNDNFMQIMQRKNKETADAINAGRVLLAYKDLIASCDATMFTKAVFIGHKINLTLYWKRSRNHPEQREYIWKMLKRLVVYASILVEPIKQEPVLREELTDFNAVEGIKADEAPSVDQLAQQIDDIKIKDTDILNKAMEMAGFKYNVEDLKNQIKNVNEEQLNQIPDMLNQMLGTNGDKEVNDVLATMTHDVGDVLKRTDITNGNMFENITNVAKQVIEKYSGGDSEHLPLEKLVNPMMTMMDKMGLPRDMNSLDPAKLMSMMTKMALGLPGK